MPSSRSSTSDSTTEDVFYEVEDITGVKTKKGNLISCLPGSLPFFLLTFACPARASRERIFLLQNQMERLEGKRKYLGTRGQCGFLVDCAVLGDA